ncbi:MAG: tyrosine-type recombinase/integrase [Patescibacteria group bacterium]|nr:tyrosine-type recombinase/integrase [Patescibacteria group bacterium]MDD5715591.1 tyrosine-type recombinase/integrase [Patescibacteria group bacterium]
MAAPLQQSLDGFLGRLSQENSVGNATIRNYRFYLSRFLTWRAFPEPSAITGEAIDEFRHYLAGIRNQRGELMKQTTQNYHLIALRAFLDYLNAQGMAVPRGHDVKLNRIEQRHQVTITDTDLERLLEAPLNMKNPGIVQKRDKALLELLFSTGLKVSELSNLRRDHARLEEDEMPIRGTGSRMRSVPFTHHAKFWIKEYLDVRTDALPALFIRHDRAKRQQLTSVQPDEYKLTPRTIQRIVKKYAASSGLPRSTTPESLRQAFASFLLRRGDDIETVQKTLGHVSLTTTKLYAKSHASPPVD